LNTDNEIAFIAKTTNQFIQRTDLKSTVVENVGRRKKSPDVKRPTFNYKDLILIVTFYLGT